MPCVYLPGPAPAVTVANNKDNYNVCSVLHSNIVHVLFECRDNFKKFCEFERNVRTVLISGAASSAYIPDLHLYCPDAPLV
jgi:hypothetical protein